MRTVSWLELGKVMDFGLERKAFWKQSLLGHASRNLEDKNAERNTQAHTDTRQHTHMQPHIYYIHTHIKHIHIPQMYTYIYNTHTLPHTNILRHTQNRYHTRTMYILTHIQIYTHMYIYTYIYMNRNICTYTTHCHIQIGAFTKMEK